MDFVRELLLKVEADEELDGYTYKSFDATDFPGRKNEEIAYHIDQLIEAGLLKGSEGTLDGVAAPISRLTWNGHEFLDSIKDVRIWTRVKERIDGLSGITFTVVAAIAEAELKKYLGLK
jgi:hypothetical protein